MPDVVNFDTEGAWPARGMSGMRTARIGNLRLAASTIGSFVAGAHLS